MNPRDQIDDDRRLVERRGRTFIPLAGHSARDHYERAVSLRLPFRITGGTAVIGGHYHAGPGRRYVIDRASLVAEWVDRRKARRLIRKGLREEPRGTLS
jgi:hypothetical protein